MLQEIKWAWQRVVRGYDDRIMWGFDSHFVLILPALRKFCENFLALKYADLNPEKQEVMKETLRLIADYQSATVYTDGLHTVYSWIDEDKKLAALAEYFGKNINVYWD